MSTTEDSFGGGFTLGFWFCFSLFFITWVLSGLNTPTIDINGKCYMSSHGLTYELVSLQPVKKEIVIVREEKK